MAQAQDNRLLTAQEAAERLHVPVATIRAWLRRGWLRGDRLRAKWSIDASGFEAFQRDSMCDRCMALSPPSPHNRDWITPVDVTLRLSWDPARVLHVLRQGRLRGVKWRRQWWVHDIDLRAFIARRSPAERAAMRAIRWAALGMRLSGEIDALSYARWKAQWLAQHVRNAEVRRKARRLVGLPEEEDA